MVSGNDNLKLFQETMLVEKINWIANNIKFPLKVNVRIRYGHPAVSAIIKLYQKKYKVVFKEAQRAITPGQSAVFYGRNEEVLGGGIIN